MGGPPQRDGSRSDKKLFPDLTHFSYTHLMGGASCACGTRPGGVGHPRSACTARLFALLFLATLPAFALDVTAPLPAYPECRVADDGIILLTKDKQLLAAARIQPASNSDAEILPLEKAKPILELEKCKTSLGRERRFPALNVPGRSLILTAEYRVVLQGLRIQATTAWSKANTAQTAIPVVPPLETAIQIYPGADGEALKLSCLDNEPAPEKLNDATTLRARALTFENAKKQQVTIERSAPATWTIRRVQKSIILTAPFVKPPRNGADPYGSFVLFLGVAHDENPPEVSALTLDKRVVPTRDAIEGSLRIYAGGANPTLPQELTVVAEVAMPPRADGAVPKKNLPCFFYEPAEPDDEEGEFRFRFTPPTEGLYGVHVYVATADSRCETDAEAFRAGVPASPGIVRIKNGERVLRLEDRTIFAPVGCDLGGFSAKDGVDAFRTKFIELERLGANTVCIGLSQLMPLEGPAAGRIDPKVAAELDEIFRAAQARNIRIILALENGADIGKNSATHPYFQEMGGPVLAPAEYFRDPAARRFFQVRMNYAAARYGAYRSLLAWELMRDIDEAWPATHGFMPLKNDPEEKGLSPAEVDIARRARRDVEEWVEAMAQQLRGVDQHNHPICVSTALDPGHAWSALQPIENLDFTLHRDFPVSDGKTDAKSIHEKFPDLESKIAQWAEASRGLKRTPRPWAIASFGVPLDTPSPLCAALANSLAAAPLLPCKPDAPLSETERNWLRSAAIFSAALAEISVYEPKDELVPRTESLGTGPNAPRVIIRGNRRGLAAWIQGGTVSANAAQVGLPGLLEGAYTITWMDAATGAILSTQKYNAPAEEVNKGLEPTVVSVPKIANDAALFIIRDAK